MKPRGRVGPRNSRGRGSGSPSTASDTTTLLLAAMLPIINNLAPKAHTSAADLPATPPRAPIQPTMPATPTKPLAPLSPVPNTASELHACLADLLKVKGIDLVGAEAVFANLDLTPDIILEVPVARLCEITGALEGRVWKF